MLSVPVFCKPLTNDQILSRGYDQMRRPPLALVRGPAGGRTPVFAGLFTSASSPTPWPAEREIEDERETERWEKEEMRRTYLRRDCGGDCGSCSFSITPQPLA
jgi:hypothetical protein